MLGYNCHVFPSWRYKLEHPVGSLRNGQTSVRSFSLLLFLFAIGLADDEGKCTRLGVGFFKAPIPLPVHAAAPQRETTRSAEASGRRLLAEPSEDASQQETPSSSQSHSDASHYSLGYWADEADSSGGNSVEVYPVLESAQSAAEHLTPSQLRSVSQLIRTTKREKIVQDEDRYRDTRFESFSTGLQNFAPANFHPFTSRRAEKFHFRQTSLAAQNPTDPPDDPSSDTVYQPGAVFNIEKVQLLDAVRGRVVSKISVLVIGPQSQQNPLESQQDPPQSLQDPLQSQQDPADDSTTCLGRKCASAMKEVSGLSIFFAESALKAQRGARGSHGLLQGFVSEVEGAVSELELEKELRWNLHIWSYLPAERAVELAEKEHILIPMDLLRREGQASPPAEKETVHKRSQRSATVGNRIKAGFNGVTSDARVGDNSANLGVKEHSWSDRVSENVYNVFIYYPKAYRDTIGSSLILSDQITETWFRTATMDFLVSVSTQMILAVANFNSYGLVHTHIRPTSFVLDLDGVVLLSDLHRAVKLGETMDCLSDRISGINDLTASPEESACMYKYASNFEEHEDRKEHIAGPMQAEFPVDSWRLGVILYRIWCREPAHDRRSDHEFHIRHMLARAAGKSVAVDAHLEQNRLFMKYCRKDIPSSLQRVIRQMLVAEPAFRKTAADVVKNSSFFHSLHRANQQALKQTSEDTGQKQEMPHKEKA